MGILEFGNLEIWECEGWDYGNIGNLEIWECGAWEYGKYGIFGIWKLWRFVKVKSIKLDPRLYSSVSYVDHPYFCPHCFDFIHQGLREVELILEEDTF